MQRRDSDDVTPLSIAVEDNNVELVRLLAEHGVDLEWKDDTPATVLFEAVGDSDKLPVITELLRVGADVNYQIPGDETVLMHAVSYSNLEIVKLLIEHGADVNFRDDAMSALSEAIDNFTAELRTIVIRNQVSNRR